MFVQIQPSDTRQKPRLVNAALILSVEPYIAADNAEYMDVLFTNGNHLLTRHTSEEMAAILMPRAA
jgi:hypothetical protein